MNIHLLSGFLGSGKTSAISKACETLRRGGAKVAVITNDQGMHLVDSYVFRNMNIPEMQVGNGCFCCNYADLDRNITFIAQQYKPEHLFAESVGTCTDLIATVVKPLRKFKPDISVSLTSVVDGRLLNAMIDDKTSFAPEVTYIYFKQLEEAETIILNKTDLLERNKFTGLLEWLQTNYPDKKVLAQNSLESADEWTACLLLPDPVHGLDSLCINYDTYAAGEAVMGYLDQHLKITNAHGSVEKAAEALMRSFIGRVNEAGAAVGHVKFGIDERYKISYTTFDKDPQLLVPGLSNTACSILVNARVQIEPERLHQFMQECVREIMTEHVVDIQASDAAFFRPGYPRPLHRID